MDQKEIDRICEKYSYLGWQRERFAALIVELGLESSNVSTHLVQMQLFSDRGVFVK